MEKCIFCEPERIKEGLLDETKNFYHRANVRGAIAPGHSMIISKEHYSCFGAMPESLDDAFVDYIEEVDKRFTDSFGEPIHIEQGIHAQSVNHAHIHFFPRVSEWYDFSNDKSFVDFIPLEIKVTEVKDIKDIRRIFEQEGEYVSIEEQGKLYVCHTQRYDGKLRPGREFPAKLTGLTRLLYWQNMTPEEQEKNNIWIKQTIEKLKRR